MRLFASKLGGLARASVGMFRPSVFVTSLGRACRGTLAPPAPQAWTVVLAWAAACCSERPLFIICSLCVCVCVCVCVYVCVCVRIFFCFLFPLFSITLQKKAEAARRILGGLGPQVELVSWGTGWGVGWRGGQGRQVGAEGRRKSGYCQALPCLLEEAGNPPS